MPKKFWDAPIDSISAPALMDFYVDLHARVPETASRILQRLRSVFGDAEFRGLCHGNAAASAAVKIRELKLKRVRGHHASLSYEQAPHFLRSLRDEK
ncbi:MAG: hypothetical protein JSW31_07440, partial [Burkholderiales bacterium]